MQCLCLLLSADVIAIMSVLELLETARYHSMLNQLLERMLNSIAALRPIHL